MISIDFNNTLCERDMDILFVEAVLTDPSFGRLLVDKTDLREKPFSIVSAELSKADSNLGESDITVILDFEGVKYGFLIEDKIDAIAMPDQHGRYVKRGEKAVEAGEYNGYRIFIFCPERYFWNNDEAKLYEHLLTYEECQAYFNSKDDPLSAFRSRQFEQAITKAKKPPTINVDEKANAFLRQYIRYQNEYYPSLDRSTREDRNGWWVEYRTLLGRVWVTHKIQEGYVDLTFSRAKDKLDIAKTIAEWAKRHKLPNVSAINSGKSVFFRVHVPKLDMLKGFDAVDQDELEQCFIVIRELTDFANVVEMAHSMALEAR